MSRPSRLPIRIAHPFRPEPEYLNDAYLDMLVRAGYEALYLDNSPFDHHTGNVAQFFKDFHLISLYDIAYSYERERMRDYIHQVCLRAQGHGLRVYLQCHEPRMPYYAWSSTPPHWRGHGGWPHNGNDATAFCWSEPDAVAWWKAMARAAFAALPEISGVIACFMDNEAVPCDKRCPKCHGEKVSAMMCDVLQTMVEIGRERDDFRVHILDWWMDAELIAKVRDVAGESAFIIGHSCKDLMQEIDGERVPGAVEDMAMISGRCSASFLQKKAFFTGMGFRFIDRTVWSHACENWFLPAPPDPAYAIEKCNALDAAGAEGWFDFDCGALEPGSIAEAVIAWTRTPDANPDTLVAEVLQSIYGDQWQTAQPAYALYSRGKNYFPAAYSAPDVFGFSSRCLAPTVALAGPWFLEDFTFFDTRHAFNWFAPFNLVTPATIDYVTPRVAKAAEITGQAFAIVERIPITSSAIQRERDAFEIHYRQYRCVTNYFRLAEAKLAWVNGTLSDGDFVQQVRAIAADELENHMAVEGWVARNPAALDNPNHYLLGRLEETWPGIAFHGDMLKPKRRSLEALVHYEICPPRPLHQRL